MQELHAVKASKSERSSVSFSSNRRASQCMLSSSMPRKVSKVDGRTGFSGAMGTLG